VGANLMPQSSSSRLTKSTNQLCLGEYIMQPGENTLLRVLDLAPRRTLTIARLEGHYAGTTFTTGQQLGRRWEVIPPDEAKARLALADQPSLAS